MKKNFFRMVVPVAMGMLFVACSESEKIVDTGWIEEPLKTGKENGHNWVELYDGGKWATCNVGANNEQDYGDYYAWGATETWYSSTNPLAWKSGKDAGYTKENAPYYKGITEEDFLNEYAKYNSSDNQSTLLNADNIVVKSSWGGSWNMPTGDDFSKLQFNCYWQWTSNYNGKNISGYIVYKAKHERDKGKGCNSKGDPIATYTLTDGHIFLPAGGKYDATTCNLKGEYGYYWTKELTTFLSSHIAVSFYFSQDRTILSSSNSKMYRYFGCSVRPILK